jgi:2'-5' RNA ligase
MKRLFTALPIPLSEEVKSNIRTLQQNLKGERIRWIPADNMHLTLKFFGDTPGKQVPELVKALKGATNAQPAFTLVMNRMGIFGSRYNPRVVWLGFEENRELYQLKRNITHHLETIGIFEDRQNFVPHLTVARIKKLSDRKFFQQRFDMFKDNFYQEILCSQLILYESILEPTGATYKVIHTFDLT